MLGEATSLLFTLRVLWFIFCDLKLYTKFPWVRIVCVGALLLWAAGQSTEVQMRVALFIVFIVAMSGVWWFVSRTGGKRDDDDKMCPHCETQIPYSATRCPHCTSYLI